MSLGDLASQSEKKQPHHGREGADWAKDYGRNEACGVSIGSVSCCSGQHAERRGTGMVWESRVALVILLLSRASSG